MAKRKYELEKYDAIEGLIEVEPPNLYPGRNYPANGNGYDAAEDEEKIHLREVLRRIRKHKWLILSIVVIVTTLTAIQAFRTKAWYTASTVIEIGKENTMTLKSGEITLNDDSDPQYLVNVNTKKLALENPELFEQVVRERKIDRNPQIIEIIEKKPLVKLPAIFGGGDNEETTAAPKIVNSSSVAATNAAAPEQESERLMPFVSYIQKNVTVEQIKNTRALKISYTDEDPKFAAEVANSVAAVFRQRSFDNQTERFTNSAEWLDRSTRELKAKVQAAEESLAAYTRANEIYSTNSGGENSAPTLTTAKLTQLHDQFIRTQTERMLKKSLFEQVQAGRIAELPEAFSDPKITRLQQQLAEKKAQSAEFQVKFGPANPKVQEVEKQIGVLAAEIETDRQGLEAKLRADYERAVKDEQSLTAALNAAKSSAVNENQASIKYNILKQDVETARALYTDFLQKTNQAKAQVAEQNNNIKIIQSAQPPKLPVGPKRLLIVLAGFVLSLGAGIGLAFFIEYLDDTIKTLEDVERYAQLPTLGVVPSIAAVNQKFFNRKEKRKEIATSEDGSQLGLEIPQNHVQEKLLENLNGHSLAGEAYRALRTSLLLSTAGTPPKTILVTSGQASEGKSTTAVNTAISLAQLGSKVIIIDCDLRRPSVHKHLNINSASGVTNYLSSKTKIEPLIQKLAIPNLSAIPSGPIPPNPAELLSSSKMKEMLAALAKSYDHIIIDSPPIVNVTDPIILSTIVDGTMMVIHGGKTSRTIVQRSRQELQSVRAKIFGVVLNNVDLRKEGYDYYYYQYNGYMSNN